MLSGEARVRDTVAGLEPEIRRFLLHAILAPQEERARLIGRLHEQAGTPQLVELLIDLEEHRLPALTLAEALKDSLNLPRI
jgi:hypothetical protein